MWNILNGRRRMESEGERRSRSRPCLETLEERATPTVVDAVNFTETSFANVSGQSTGFAWAPDGSDRLFVARKAGDVRIIQNGAVLGTPFSSDTVITNSECGLIGIAFDRDYVTNRYVYLFLTVSTTEQQILRYTDADNNNVADAGSRTVIVSGLPTVGNNHDGGAIAFGFDNRLYWAVGDLGNNTGVDGNLTSLAAKIGRASLTGAALNDNPFFDGAGTNNDYIWSRGWRNPFTMTFQETTGQLWVNGVGTTYEQIFKVNAGDHAGWNDWEGNQPAGFIQPEIVYRTGNTDSRTIVAGGAVRSGNVATFTTTIPSTPSGSSGAAFLHPGNKIVISGVSDSSFNGTYDILSVISNTQFTVAQSGADATSGGGTAVTVSYGRAVLGGAFNTSTGFTSAYRDNFFFGDLVNGTVMRAVLDANNNVISVNAFATGISQYTDAAFGPDGALYYLQNDGRVRRTVFNHSAQSLIVTPNYQAFPEGGQAAFNVRLATAPAGNVTVNVARTAGDADLTVTSGATLTFTPTNWSTPQVVMLAAAGDADTTNDSAVLSITSAGLSTQTLTYTAIDAGGQSLVLSTTAVTVNEGGSNTFTVRLQDAPSGNVTVTVARTSGDVDITVTGGASLTFTPQNYAAPQIVTIAAAEDGDSFNDTATISVTAPSAAPRTVSITAIDNDTQSPSITTSPDTTAVVNAPYTYDVDASGTPAPGFTLVAAPPGMSIDEVTGVVTWTPTAAGPYNVTVRAANGVSPHADQSYSIQVSPDAPPTASITLPTNGSVVSGTNAEFFGDGVDDVDSVRAEFYIDDVLVYNDINQNHFHIHGGHGLWDTTLLTNGPHTLRMVVYDTAGQSDADQVVVTVDNPAPTILGISPVIGPTTGGTIVIINGAHFNNVSAVTFGGTAAATFTVSGGTQITATTAPRTAGIVDVVVATPAGTASLEGASDFTYERPAVAQIQINGGPGVVLGSGNTVSLLGQHSVVRQIKVTFNQAVTVASDAFTVTPRVTNVTVSGGAAPSNLPVETSVTQLSASEYLVTFSGLGTHHDGIINSGIYDLTTAASKVQAGVEAMDANRVDPFFAMFGTVDGNNSYTAGTIGDGGSNAFVDPGSLFEFSDAFGSSAATPSGPPAYNVVFDSNLDGFVDPSDLFAFSDSFGINWVF